MANQLIFGLLLPKVKIMRFILTAFLFLLVCISKAQIKTLQVAANQQYLQTNDGKPFFYLGDTGWLLLKKCKKAAVIKYLNDRQQKGFNVIQVMLLHDLSMTNAYGDSALVNHNIAQPKINSIKNKQPGYWRFTDFVLKEAAKRGIYLALVPLWGSNIKKVSAAQIKKYATFLAKRYQNQKNIIWLNGGDVRGDSALNKWNELGNTLNQVDGKHLITFHPRGRTSSSLWFQKESWLNFNMFQSGHRNYRQDTTAKEPFHFGEDNWKYVEHDLKLFPQKPTMDGEPSYENIPQGLHDAHNPYWQDADIRRYAYWSVLAGACGFTYGNNEVMQFYTSGKDKGAYWPKQNWQKGLSAPGAVQMTYLKRLIINENFYNKRPCTALIAKNGIKYQYIIAACTHSVAIIYVFKNQSFHIDATALSWKINQAYWFSPRNGKKANIINFNPQQLIELPKTQEKENDWILVLRK